MQYGYQCGMIWGAALAAGAQAYRQFGAGPEAETHAMLAAQRLVESFRSLNHHINCVDITGIDKSSSKAQMMIHFLLKGGTIRCFHMAARYAKVAFNEIHSAFSEKQIEVPVPPVSCASVLAQKLGLSDLHTVMAAGFAGGIGLSGAACGALGVAIWKIAMNELKNGTGEVHYQAPQAQAIIDQFVKCTDETFTCSAIVGRNFKNLDDHADYVRSGGCSDILESLASG